MIPTPTSDLAMTPRRSGRLRPDPHVPSYLPSHYCGSAPIKGRLFALGVGLLTAATSTAIGQSTGAGGEAIQLSPFSVSATSDVGYQATTSLAGTRLNTELRDLGSAISVVTEEFIRDTGATSIADLLVYTTGTEVGGAFGNFSNSAFSGGRAGQQSNRENPEGNTRVRGLVRAEVSRDFFISDFGFDSFNVERVDISRGPNSVLFGVGSPGGVINFTTKKATLLQDLRTISFRVGSQGTHRSIADLNQVLVPERLAARIILLNERENFRQKPAFEKDRRLHGSLESVLRAGSRSGILGATKLGADVELARVKTTPPNVIAPTDNIRDWYDLPDVGAISNQTGQPAPARYTNGTFVSQALHDRFGTNAPYQGSLAQRLPFFIAVAPIYADIRPGVPPNIGFSNPALADVQGALGRVQGSFDWLMQSNLVEETWTTGFTARTFQDRDIYDFRNQLITGRTESREDDFENFTLRLEQLFMNGRGGFEVSHNQQSLSRRLEFPFSDFRSADVWVDNNLWMGNRERNPNAGRPFMISRAWGNHDIVEIDRQTSRLTGFYDLDFGALVSDRAGKWLGRHVFSGIVERAQREQLTRRWAMAVSSNEIDMELALSGLKNNQRRQLHAGFYVGPDLRPFGSYDEVRMSDYIGAKTPKNGDAFKTFVRDPATRAIRYVSAYADEFLNDGSASRRVIDTEAITLQSYLMDRHVVALYGLRRDHVTDTLNVGGNRLADGAFDPATLALRTVPSLDAKGDTTTLSVVAHFPEKYLFELPAGSDFSLFWTKSENFQPTGFRQDVFLKAIAPPKGETTERGFTLSFLDNRFAVRANWFETTNDNISLPGNLATGATNTIFLWLNTQLEAKRLGVPFGFAANGRPTGADAYFSGYDELIQTLLAMVPEPLAGARNLRLEGTGVGLDNVAQDVVPGLVSTSSFVAKGVEIELVANPTSNWTLALNVAKQETVQSGSGAELQSYYGEIRQSLIDARLWDTNVADNPSTTGDTTFRQRLTRDFLNPLASVASKDGTASQEQRKWRANFATAYRFRAGSALAGFEVGGAVRWQDKAAVGYPIILVTNDGDTIQTPDLRRPYHAPAVWNGALFVRYGRKIWRDIDWSVQLNLRNFLGDDELTPEVINPDGSWAVVRAPVEKSIFLTNTFSF
jgi:outer membrane receptor protein involved in Fe transport